MTFIMSPQSFINVKIIHIFIDQRSPVKYLKNQKANFFHKTRDSHLAALANTTVILNHWNNFFIFLFHLVALGFLASIWFLASSKKSGNLFFSKMSLKKTPFGFIDSQKEAWCELFLHCITSKLTPLNSFS